MEQEAPHNCNVTVGEGGYTFYLPGLALEAISSVLLVVVLHAAPHVLPEPQLVHEPRVWSVVVHVGV